MVANGSAVYIYNIYFTVLYLRNNACHSERSFIKESYVTELPVLETLHGLPVPGSHFNVEVLHALPQINGPPTHNVSTHAL